MTIELLGEDERKLAAVAKERRERTFEERFREYDATNPTVYRLLVHFSRQLRDRGYHRAGIRNVWERMRWEMMLATSDPAGFKLNDHFTSRYARKIMAENPDLREFFRTRELRSK
jgi:hypothetical protein